MTNPPAPAPQEAKLIFVSGSKSGTSVRLVEGTNTIGRSSGRDIIFARDEILVSAEHAQIVYYEGQFVLNDQGSRNGTFVNRERITQRVLESGDIIEFGQGGPSAQFVIDDAYSAVPTLDLSDRKTPAALRRLQSSSGADQGASGVFNRGFTTTREFVAMAYQKSSRRTRRTTIALASLTVLVVAAAVSWQAREQRALQESLTRFAMDLETEQGTRALLEQNLTDIQARYDSLLRTVEANEQELQARAASNGSGRNVAARYSGGVGLIVYSYGFVRRGTDELLRMQVDDRDQVMTRMNRFGQIVPVFDFGGAGEAVQRQGSATGFLVDSAGWVLTNRHVAEPWTTDDGLATLRRDGWDVEPQFTTLRIYFPPGDRSQSLEVQRTSKAADVALLRTQDAPVGVPVLQLAQERYLSPPGEEIVFIGYPTGVHNLMFRVAGEERAEILKQVGDEPVDLARELARRHRIQPLVTNGSISDTTNTELIHTAEATGGGSGGPLLTNSGSVVGIHYAAVRSPIEGDPFQTQRAVRIRFGWEMLPVEVRNKLRSLREAATQR